MDDDPAGWQQRLLEHRTLEAEGKERTAKALLAAEALKTANQDLYDVNHYDLDLTLNPRNKRLTGSVTTTATVTGAGISTLDLDLRDNMTVAEVRSAGLPVSFTHVNNLVTAQLERTYLEGETVSVSVDYEGNPDSGYFGWDTFEGETMIWTLSEPFGARYWWPCKDLNTDKADSVDITVTVPSDLIVASNGLLLSDVIDGVDRTFHWKSNYPIATYLVSLAIHPYVQYSDWYTPQGGGPDMEVQFYVFPSHVGSVEPTYALTVPMIEAFAQGFGEYPFVDEKYGHAEFIWGGAMEHQTITSMGAWYEDMISHELAHQWWGDMVTCADFHHVWLNEGFATWSEAYWAEMTYGMDVYHQYMDAAAFYGPGTVFIENPYTDNIFDVNLSYNKGSWVVHMLRGVLGDADFFAALAQYRAAFEYGSATTQQLQAIFEAQSGVDLEPFLQQWVYGEYYPIYEHNWAPGPGPGEITLTLAQVQDNAPPFTMPVQVRILTDLGPVDVTVQNSTALEQYVIPVSGTVESVQIDPDRWILRLVQDQVVDPTFDRGILLVNGVDWNTYTTEITSAYADNAFWGDNPITFWDCFPEPSGGYPANLPAPLGHGTIPGGTLGKYSTVIWVGNNYNGDLARWAETPIQSYLETGGNVLLLARQASQFLAPGGLGDYLGVTWAETNEVLGDCTAVDPGLVSIPFTGYQSLNDVFHPAVGPETTLLLTDTSGFAGVRGTGAVVVPAVGGTVRSDGGRLALISGRPYRMDHTALRTDAEAILSDWLLEPYNPDLSAVPPAADLAPGLALGRNHPNPFNPTTVIPFTSGTAQHLRLRVYDARGRLVRTLADRVFPAGEHAIHWDGRDRAGATAPAGAYFVRLEGSDGTVTTRGLMMVR